MNNLASTMGKRLPAVFLLLGLSAVAGCDSLPDGDEVPVVLADCSEPLVGLGWGDFLPVDVEPGIEDELLEMDFSLLPESLDISQVGALQRGFIAFALDIAPQDLGPALDRDETEAAGVLGTVVLGSLLAGQNDPSGMDFFFFRRGLYRYYTCSSGFPTTLDGFLREFNADTQPQGTVVDSVAKCGDRRLILDSQTEVYLAETLVGGEVRETEVLIGGRRSDGGLDFAIYGADGQLTDRSVFPTLSGDNLMLPGPYSCMSCHVDSAASETTWGFQVLVPEVGPCAEE